MHQQLTQVLLQKNGPLLIRLMIHTYRLARNSGLWNSWEARKESVLTVLCSFLLVEGGPSFQVFLPISKNGASDWGYWGRGWEARSVEGCARRWSRHCQNDKFADGSLPCKKLGQLTYGNRQHVETLVGVDEGSLIPEELIGLNLNKKRIKLAEQANISHHERHLRKPQ